jgi:1-acyl-sn-glycerol-3-phosphate acyltransferase
VTNEHLEVRSWAPSSPCTPGCLPDATNARGGGLRMAAMAAVLLTVVALSPLLPARASARLLRRSSRVLLAVAGITLVLRGDEYAPAGQGVLVVANHLSWIDVVALNTVAPVRMLAKREVAEWPVIGGLATRMGALFVDRAGLSSLPATVADTAQALREGSTVGVFPEGTTWCGAAAGTFRRAAFQAAIDAGVPVRPVAIVMRDADGELARASAFVGEQTLLDSMRRVVRAKGLVCEMTLLPLIPVEVDGDRRALAARAALAVGSATGVAHGGVREAARPAAVAVA